MNVNKLFEIINTIMEGGMHGFYNKSCQPGVTLFTQTVVNFWIDELKESSIEDIDKLVTECNDRLLHMSISKMN